MCANPEPEDAIFDLGSQRPVVKTNPHGPENINLLEVQGRVVGVSLQEGESPVGKRSDVCREGSVRTPKVRTGVVGHSREERPAW